MTTYTLRFLLRGAFFALICTAWAQDPNLIDVSTLEQLDAIRYDLDGDGVADETTDEMAYNAAFGTVSCPDGCEGYELTANLDFSGSKWASDCTSSCLDEDGNTTSNTPTVGWEPIGYNNEPLSFDANMNKPFVATFDGNDHTISNLYINRPNTTHVGLFGHVYGATVRNLGIVGGSVSGRTYVGGLMGWANSFSITACYATANVIATGNDRSEISAGGLVGHAEDDFSITACYTTANVTTTGNDRGEVSAGGLIGSATPYFVVSSITACYATGDVTVNVNQRASAYAGGLVGWTASISLTACYATGNVAVTTTNGSDIVVPAGGLVGFIHKTSITACYATANVTVITSGRDILAEAGGLVGSSVSSSSITACYATGDVTVTNGSRDTYVGGLVGATMSTSITASYFDSDVSNRPASDPYAKTTSELQSPTTYDGIYEAWDVVSAWSGTEFHLWALCGDSEYPALYVDFNGDGTPTLTEFGSQSSCAQAPPAYTPPPNTGGGGSTGGGDTGGGDTGGGDSTGGGDTGGGGNTGGGNTGGGNTGGGAGTGDGGTGSGSVDDAAVVTTFGTFVGEEDPYVYPNPVARELRLMHLAPYRTYRYRMYSIVGQVVQEGELRSSSVIDLSSVEMGQYVFILEENERELLRTRVQVLR